MLGTRRYRRFGQAQAGMVQGIGSINAHVVGRERMPYALYTVTSIIYVT